jgi:hypothetical protein
MRPGAFSKRAHRGHHLANGSIPASPRFELVSPRAPTSPTIQGRAPSTAANEEPTCKRASKLTKRLYEVDNSRGRKASQQ